MNNLKKTLITTAMLLTSFDCLANQKESDELSRFVLDKKIMKVKVIKRDVAKILERAKLVQDASFLGAGSTGGGQGHNGFLRDLESGPELECNKNMVNFIQDYPTFNELMGIIGNVNIGFAIELQKEMDKVTICEVYADLRDSIVKNQDGMIISKTSYDQLAIRAIFPNDQGYGVHVYLDKNEFESMKNEKHQSFLLFHELMHSFVKPDPAVSYINRLRSVSAKYYQIYKNGSVTLNELDSIAKKYRMNTYKSPFEYAKSYVNLLSNGHESILPVFKAIVDQSNLNKDELFSLAHNFLDSQYLYIDLSKDVIDYLITKGLDLEMEYEGFGLKQLGYRGTLLETTLILNNLKVSEYLLTKSPEYEMEEDIAKKLFYMLDINTVKGKNINVVNFLWHHMSTKAKKAFKKHCYHQFKHYNLKL